MLRRRDSSGKIIHDYGVLVFHYGHLLVETWNDGLGSVSTEVVATKGRIDDPDDPATHMSVTGLPLPEQPWADLSGYTRPRPGKPAPKRVRPGG
jgi:hypothetical protein